MFELLLLRVNINYRELTHYSFSNVEVIIATA